MDRGIAPDGIAAYTAICGGFDPDRNDIRVFRDSAADRFREPVMNAKIYKILPHQWFDEPYRIWMDGNIFPRKDLPTLVEELLGDHDIAVFHHPWRNCIYEEHGPAKARLDPRYHPLIDDQVARYRREGMPARYGLAECGVILSRANEPAREFFERWWAEVTRFSSRDQMSFPYIRWKMGARVRVRFIDRQPTRFGEWFRYVERPR